MQREIDRAKRWRLLARVIVVGVIMAAITAVFIKR
jgi:hypothetical protein